MGGQPTAMSPEGSPLCFGRKKRALKLFLKGLWHNTAFRGECVTQHRSHQRHTLLTWPSGHCHRTEQLPVQGRSLVPAPGAVCRGQP